MSGHHERDIKFTKKALSKEQSSLAEGFFCELCPLSEATDTNIFEAKRRKYECRSALPEVTDTNIFRLKGEKYECHSPLFQYLKN